MWYGILGPLELVDHLWGDEAPLSARRLLHGCIANLRRTLAGTGGEGQPLVRQGPGYQFRVTPATGSGSGTSAGW